MGYKDRLQEALKQNQTASGYKARVNEAVKEEQKAQSGADRIRQLAEQVAQTQARKQAFTINGVTPTATRTEAAPGTMSGADFLRQMSAAAQRQGQERQAAQTANNAALRYSLQQASRGAEAQALGIAESMRNMGKGQFDRTARGNLVPYSGMPLAAASRATLGLTHQARQLIGLEQRYTGLDQTYRTRLLDAAENAVAQRADELAKYASSDDYAAAQRAEAERLRNQYGPIMENGRVLTSDEINQRADAAMRRYYQELPYTRDFKTHKVGDNPVARASVAMSEEFGKRGNVDLWKRPMIPGSRMASMGWTDAGDGTATLFSSTYSAGNTSEGYDLQYGKNVVINATPIREDGLVLTPGQLDRYIEKLTKSGDILEADKPINGGQGLIISVDDVTGSLDEAYDKAGMEMERLHELQADYYEERSVKPTPVEYELIDSMEPIERQTFTYLQGTQGIQAALDYLNSIRQTLEARRMGRIERNMQQLGKEDPVLASAASAVENIAGTIESGGYVAGRLLDAAGRTAGRLFDRGNTSPQALAEYFRNNLSVDENSRWFTPQVMRDSLRAGVSANMSPIGQLIYQAGMSGVVDSYINMLTFGHAGEYMMGLNAMAGTVRETKLRGGDDMQAMAMGINDGAWEVITEHLGFDRVRGLFGASRDKIIPILLTSGLSEFGEEAASDIAHIIADIIIMGDKNELDENVRRYMAGGVPRKEAEKRALINAGEEILLSGMGGMLGGLVMGGGSAATGQLARLFDTTVQGVARLEMEKMGKAYDQRAREVFLNSWDGQTTPAEYKTAFDALYDSGRLGVSLEQTQETAGEALRGMEPARQYQIWQAGENAAQAERQEYTDPISGEDFTSEMPARKAATAANANDSQQKSTPVESVESIENSVEYNENAAGRESTVTQNAEVPGSSAKKSEFKSGVTRAFTARKLTHEQRLRMRNLDMIGKRLGMEIVMVDSLKKGKANGAFKPGARRIFVAMDSKEGAYVQVAGHEMVHYIRSESEESYQVLARLVDKYLREEDGYDLEERIKKRIAEYADTQQLTEGLDGTAMEEIVAETVPQIFADEAYIREIVQQDATLGQKIRETIENCIRVFRQIIEEITSRNYEDIVNYAFESKHPEAALLIDQTEKLQEMAKAFESAMEKANEAHETKQAARETTEANAETALTNAETALTNTETALTGEQEEMQAAASIKYALDSYTDHEKENWATSKKIVIYKDQQQLAQFVDDALIGKNIGKKLYFGKIPANMAQDILAKTGVNVAGYNSSLAAQEIRKIMKDHGDAKSEALRGQRAIVPTDYERIPAVLQGYESVELSKDDYRGKPVLEFTKRFHDGKMTVVGVVSDKHLDLFVQTMYSSKKSLATVTDDQASVNTPEAARGTAPDENIPQEKAEVKGKDRQSLKNLPDKARFSIKRAQFELIQRTNPMTDDYHVGIRAESDIKTAEEALGTRNDDEWYVYPDWKWEDGQRALQSGKVTLYSSHTIEEGAFVSPSRMMASDYAGDGNVYSKRVSVNDVAWINADEGQYAPVSDQPGVRFSMKAPVERKDELVAVHNLDSYSMEETLKRGGFIMPSTAVVKAEHGHDGFGEFSVVFNSAAIDPQADSRNRIYSQDAFTPKFPQWMADESNENILEYMLNSAETGGDVGFDVNLLTAKAAKRFKSLDEVRGAKDQLTNDTTDVAMKIGREYLKTNEILRDISLENNASLYSPAGDKIKKAIMYASQVKRDRQSVKDAFAQYGATLSDENADRLIGLYEELSAAQTLYFEAKPRRIVDFKEVAAVLVPDDADPGLMDAIEAAGMKAIRYKAGDEDDRRAKLNSIDQPGVRFALKNTSDTPVETARVLAGIDGRPAIQVYGTAQTGDAMDDAYEAGPVSERAWPKMGLQEDMRPADDEAFEPDDFEEDKAEETKAAAPQAEARKADAPRAEAKERFRAQKTAQTENRVSREAAQAEKAALQTAKQILKEYESKYDKNAMRDNMLALTEEIARNGASDDTLREATQLARAIIEQSSHVDNGLREQYKDLRKILRETPVTLTETQKAEAANIAGSYGAFRRSVFGTFNLATEGKSLDAIWDEWSGMAPDLFTPQMNEGDMVQRLVDIRAAFMPTVSNPYGEDMDGASVDLGLRLQGSVLKALGDDAGAKDMAAAVAELRRQYQDAMREERMRVKMQQRAAFDQIAAALRDARNTGDEAAKDAAMAAYRGQMKRIGAEAAEAQARLAYRLRFEDQAERAKTWERITKYATDMRNTLAKPNKKKHVPQELQKDLLGVLEGLDFTRNGRVSEGTQAWKDSLTRIDQFLSEQLLRQQNPQGDTRGIWMSVCQPALDLFHANVEVIRNARGPINQMTLNEMKNLSSALAQVNHAINSINEMWTSARHETVDAVAGRTMDELDKVRTNRAQNSAAPIRMLDTMLNVENLDAGSFFQRLGKAAMTVYDGLREGQSKAYARIREANEAAKSIFTNSKREIRKWAKEQHDVGVSYGAELRTVKMTGTQLMELYALSRREQGRKHLLTGGFELEAKDGKSGDGRIYKLTEDQLNAAVSQLSADQRATTERMQDYLSHTVSEWGNEVTERMYLYRMFGEDHYWPIRSATGFQHTREQDGTVLYNAQTNAGFTKNVQDEVRNPLRIGDAITTFSGHVSDMATFSGLAMPVDDLLRWYNYAARDENGHMAYTTSVKNEIRRTLGKDGISYVQHLLDDLNGMGKSAQESPFVKWMMSSYKRAAIMAKLRVVIQQPTAILRASAEINPAYLTAAVRGIGKHTVNEMQEHSALAWWKGNGNYEIGTGQSMKSIVTGMQDSAKDAAFEWMNKPAGWADDKGWATIWRAVKAETAARHKDLTVGSDAYWEHVTNRFEEICMKTQVVDTVLTRSAMMRSKSALQKMATAFMSEPTKTVNMIRNAMGEFHRAQQAGDKTGKKQAAGKIIRSGAAIAAATALNALATAAFDALKYYDPEDKDEEGNPVTRLDLMLDNWMGDFTDSMNPLTNIPYVKDVYAVLQGEDVERMDLSAISRLVNAVIRADKYFRQGNPNGYTTWAAVKPLVTGLGDVLGLPVSGLVANTEFALNIIQPGLNRSKARAATVSGAVEEIYEAITSGDREKADRLRANMEKGQYGRDPMSEKEISKKLTDMLARSDDRVRQAWEAKQDIDGGATYTRLRNALMSDGWTKNEANYAIEHYDDVMIADAQKGLREANEKEDAETAEAWRDVLRDFGQTEEQIAKAEAEKDLEETLESPKATYRDLYQMLRAGETAEASDLRGQLRAQGKTPEEISKGVADQLAMNDDRIQALWEKRQKGKATTAADYRTIQADGFSDEEVKQAVNRYPNIVQSDAKKLLLQAQTDGDKAAMETYRQRLLSVGTKSETIDGWLAGKDMDAELEDVAAYKTENLMASIRSAETTAADIQDIRDYLMSRSTAADPMKSIQSSITSAFKEEYIDLVTSGKTREAERLKKNMLLAGAKEETIDNWVPAQAKSEGKSALMAAIDKGDERAAIAEVDRMLDNEIATVDSIRDSLNKVYKPKYFELMDAGKEREADALADLLAGLGLKKKNGENYYRGAWWNEEYRKHLKEIEE